MQISFKSKHSFTLCSCKNHSKNLPQLAELMEQDLKEANMGLKNFTYDHKTKKGSFKVDDEFDNQVNGFLSYGFPHEHNLQVIGNKKIPQVL